MLCPEQQQFTNDFPTSLTIVYATTLTWSCDSIKELLLAVVFSLYRLRITTYYSLYG